MQFVDILNDIYDRTGQNQSGSVDASVSRRIKRFVNRWNRRVLSMAGMDSLRRVTGLTFASVADQPTYGLQLQSITWMRDAAISQSRIFPQTLGWYRTRFPNPAQFSGTPQYYVELQQARILTVPSAPCELFIVSTAAGTGVIKVEAIRSNGYRVSLSKALNGLTPTSMSSTITDVVDIVDVRLAAAEAGDVTITQGSGGTVLSKIVIGQTYPRFLRFALVPTPSQAITYAVDGVADIVDLVNDYDEPFENADFHDILVDGGVHDEWQTRGRMSEARLLLDGGSVDNPPKESLEGRIRRLRASLLTWPDSLDTRSRSEQETIRLPLT